MRIEWRTKGEGQDSLVSVDPADNHVVRVVAGEPKTIRAFLNDMNGLDSEPAREPKGLPEDWGRLVMARDESGEVISLDPGLYWDGIYDWFRSRGADPHARRAGSQPSDNGKGNPQYD